MCWQFWDIEHKKCKCLVRGAVSGDTKGGAWGGIPPSRRLCPHLPPPTRQKGENSKNQPFLANFLIFAASNTHFAPRCPLPLNKFWCRHRVQYPLKSSPTKQSGAAFLAIRSVIWGVGLLSTMGCWCFGCEIPCLVDDETCISGMGVITPGSMSIFPPCRIQRGSSS